MVALRYLASRKASSYIFMKLRRIAGHSKPHSRRKIRQKPLRNEFPILI